MRKSCEEKLLPVAEFIIERIGWIVGDLSDGIIAEIADLWLKELKNFVNGIHGAFCLHD